MSVVESDEYGPDNQIELIKSPNLFHEYYTQVFLADHMFNKTHLQARLIVSKS